ncbi:hypothetical protein chiPu_0030640 [Chiloscyllium punctatum]|uniref:Uncharacterized protein n=1 Tax=Chiloscyllium punctatum TaxID=137246 RepID=A0A401TU77_CHIPU|nr:hypothetical protein [Chiloscyllium punctatum]
MQDRTPARARAPSGTGRGSDDALAREWIRRAAADRGLWQPGEAGRTRRGFRRRRGRGFRLLQKQRGLEHYAGGLLRRSHAHRAVAAERAGQLRLDLVAPEHGGERAVGIAVRRQDRREAVLVKLIGAAICEHGVAAADPAIVELDYSGAFAPRRPEPRRILSVSLHDRHTNRNPALSPCYVASVATATVHCCDG